MRTRRVQLADDTADEVRICIALSDTTPAVGGSWFGSNGADSSPVTSSFLWFVEGRLGDAGRDGGGEAACAEVGAIVLIKASIQLANPKVGDKYRKGILALKRDRFHCCLGGFTKIKKGGLETGIATPPSTLSLSQPVNSSDTL